MEQWLFASALSYPPRNPPLGIPQLRSGQPNVFRLHDLGGVVWQFCREQDRFVLVGGSCSTSFNEDDAELPNVPCSATGFESSEFGFRPVLILS